MILFFCRASPSGHPFVLSLLVDVDKTEYEFFVGFFTSATSEYPGSTTPALPPMPSGQVPTVPLDEATANPVPALLSTSLVPGPSASLRESFQHFPPRDTDDSPGVPSLPLLLHQQTSLYLYLFICLYPLTHITTMLLALMLYTILLLPRSSLGLSSLSMRNTGLSQTTPPLQHCMAHPLTLLSLPLPRGCMMIVCSSLCQVDSP